MSCFAKFNLENRYTAYQAELISILKKLFFSENKFEKIGVRKSDPILSE